MKKMQIKACILTAFIAVSLLLAGCSTSLYSAVHAASPTTSEQSKQSLSNDTNIAEQQSNNLPVAELKVVSSNTPGKALKLHVIDVGQANCLLLNTPDGKVILVDAGNGSDEKVITNYLKNQGITTIDAFLLTHPHEDHIGSAAAVLKAFKITRIIMPAATTNTKVFSDLLSTIKSKGLKITKAVPGLKIDLDSSIKIDILAPNSNSYDDLNNYSVVMKVTYGSTSYMLTGDAEEISETEILSKNYNLKSDVLQISHHGSSSSTSTQFLKAVSPNKAIISVGKDNDYGHPAASTLKRLQDAKIDIYRTDEVGSIIVSSDGKTITIDKKASTIKENAPPNKAADEYIGNASTKKFHKTNCKSLPAPKNQVKFKTREDAVKAGYAPCKICNP